MGTLVADIDDVKNWILSAWKLVVVLYAVVKLLYAL